MQFRFSDQVITINVPTRAALERRVRDCLRRERGFALATVNLDHLVKMSASARFAQVYARQDMVVADGRPIVGLSRIAGRPVELMPGSDMVLPLCRWAAAEGRAIALVGSTAQALADAERALCDGVPGLVVALRIAPPQGFDPSGAEADAILKQLDAAGVGLCFLALGAPKQETLALRGRQLAPRVGFASVGAGLDFLGGHQRRAPRWMRRVGLEWLWRAASSPLRLVPRYLKCALILPGQVLAARRLRRTGDRG